MNSCVWEMMAGGGSFSEGGVGQGRKPPAEWDLAEVKDWVTRLGRGAEQRAAAFQQYGSKLHESGVDGFALQELASLTNQERLIFLQQASRCW